jgi:hypothetical protein
MNILHHSLLSALDPGESIDTDIEIENLEW